jgi:hypothetical protein
MDEENAAFSVYIDNGIMQAEKEWNPSLKAV